MHKHPPYAVIFCLLSLCLSKYTLALTWRKQLYPKFQPQMQSLPHGMLHKYLRVFSQNIYFVARTDGNKLPESINISLLTQFAENQNSSKTLAAKQRSGERKASREEKNIDVQITSLACRTEGYVGKVSGKLEAVLLSNSHFCQICIFWDTRVLLPAPLCWNRSSAQSRHQTLICQIYIFWPLLLKYYVLFLSHR